MPNEALTVRNASAVQDQWTPEQVQLLKDTIAKGATNDELALFIEVCRKKNLDPWSKQIYMIKRWDSQLKREVATFQVSIDGLRATASRTGLMDGHGGPWWCGEDGEWKDVWISPEPPTACKILIYRKGCSQPFTGIALYREYVQTDRDGRVVSMWRKMGANQLAKVAEALGTRKAFPEESGGLYAHEEMGQAESREAQQEVANAKIAVLQRNQVPEETMRWANIDPAEVTGTTEFDPLGDMSRQAIEATEPPATVHSIEQREVAKQSEAAEALQGNAKKNAGRRGTISFNDLKKFGALKGSLREVTGDDTAYYAVLREKGFDHANELDYEDVKPVYKVLGLELNRVKRTAELRRTLEEAQTVLGAAFADILGRDFACASIEDAMALDGTQLDALLTRLREESDARRSKV